MMQWNRQRQAAEIAVFRFGEFRLDLAREELIGPAGTCVLRRKVFNTLRVLLEAAPAVVTLDELLDRVWGRHAISASAVPNVIAELRRALSDGAQVPRYVETRHRRGYRMRAAVERQTVERERRAASADLPSATLLGTLDETCAGADEVLPRRRLEQLQRTASERGLTFLALQAQLALQMYANAEAASFDEEASNEPVTTSALRR